MEFFQRRNSALYLEDVALSKIAERVGTPCYVYSRALIEANWRAYDHAFGGKPHSICYAVKANSNLAVLGVLADLGSWFDIVSVGELERVLMAGGRPERVVFSGVAKTHDELERALQVGIHCFDVESIEELQRLSQIAQRLDKVAAIAVRVNPDVDAKTHPYIATGLKETKFGVGFNSAVETYLTAANLPNIEITGIAAHIGSQITEAAPFIEALECMLTLIQQLATQGIEINHLDIGGGLGIRYQDEAPPNPQSLIEAMVKRVHAKRPDLTIYVEPGRSIVGNAGALLTKIEYLKSNDSKHFAVVDAGLNDILRPALYKAWQNIVPATERKETQPREYDVVGPVCETSDLLGSKRRLAVESGDVLVIMDAGAYGHVMSSNYNSRPRPPEVMVDGGQYHVVRRRETINQLLAAESVLPAN
ncbi:MAG: diaminopimelate decarboxylase [Arenicellales bacterium]|nr:diaminopimelate decarboxylase [Arenicellales bacterium]